MSKTTEEKAKLYDEALEKAKKIHNFSSDIAEIKRMEEIFPELKESEDERIRKTIYGWIYTQPSEFFDNGFSKEEMLTWIEKQGEQKLQSKTALEAIKEEKVDNANKVEPKFKVGNKVKSIIDGFECTIEGIDNTCYYGDTTNFDIQDQDEWELIEQKPADKVEPKFHLNEWVMTDKNDVVQIKAVNNGYYTIDNGMDFNMPYVDKCWRKWTIEDANDGDVLVASDKSLFIYDGSINEFASAGFHIAFTKDMDIVLNSDDGRRWEEKDSCLPATKEQRDTLERAMTNAGYRWNKEELKLEKIEQKSVEWNNDEIEEWIGCEAFPEGTNITPLPDAIKIVKKTAHHFYKLGIKHRNTQNWTDEDETNLNTAAKSCIRAGNYYVVDWLKSLKDRIQPQERVEWSEEDESMLTRCIGALGKCYMGELPTKVEEEINWLKSLRPQKHWKPTEEQIDALLFAEGFVRGHCAIEIAKELTSLYEQLKTL